MKRNLFLLVGFTLSIWAAVTFGGGGYNPSSGGSVGPAGPAGASGGVTTGAVNTLINSNLTAQGVVTNGATPTFNGGTLTGDLDVQHNALSELFTTNVLYIGERSIADFVAAGFGDTGANGSYFFYGHIYDVFTDETELAWTNSSGYVLSYSEQSFQWNIRSALDGVDYAYNGSDPVIVSAAWVANIGTPPTGAVSSSNKSHIAVSQYTVERNGAAPAFVGNPVTADFEMGGNSINNLNIIRSGTNFITAIHIAARQLLANDGTTVSGDWSSPTNMVLGVNLLPATSNTFTIGSAALPFASGWFGPSSVHIGNSAVTSQNNGKTVCIDCGTNFVLTIPAVATVYISNGIVVNVVLP